MAKGYYGFSSKRAFIRRKVWLFHNMPRNQRKNFKPVVIDSERISKRKPIVKGKHFSDVRSSIQTQTVLKPKWNTRTKQWDLKESRQTYRVNNSSYNDPLTGSVGVIEVEEASRYTPAETQLEYVEIGPGVTQVNAVAKDNRIVKSTITSQTPAFEGASEQKSLQDRFKHWDQSKETDERLSTPELKVLGKELGVPVGGGRAKEGTKKQNVQIKLENRIRKKLAQLELQAINDKQARYFPQTTRITKKSKGREYNNQDEINLILATEMAHSQIYGSQKKQSQEQLQQEMEDLLTGASKKRPDTNYNTTQLQLGTRIESEHTKNRLVAKNIAKDHLDESPDYYKSLVKMEKGLEKKKKSTRTINPELQNIRKFEQQENNQLKNNLRDALEDIKEEN